LPLHTGLTRIGLQPHQLLHFSLFRTEETLKKVYKLGLVGGQLGGAGWAAEFFPDLLFGGRTHTGVGPRYC